jgi:hypothetical protein
MSAQRHIGDGERRARPAVRRRLAAGATAGPCEKVAQSLVALHATDPATVFLSVGARLAEPAAAAELTGRLWGVRITPRFRTPLERELGAYP